MEKAAKRDAMRLMSARDAHRIPRCAALLLLAVAWLLIASPASWATTPGEVANPAQDAIDTFEIQYQSLNTDINGRFEMSPVRIEEEIAPGETLVTQFSILSRVNDPITFDMSVSDLQASPNPNEFVLRVSEALYGAGSWVTVPTDQFSLDPGEKAYIPVRITAPEDAPVGDNYAGIDIISAATGTPENGAGVAIRGNILGQVYLTIPGDIQRSGEIVEESVTPTFLFHGTFKRNSFIEFDAQYENTGNVTDDVAGTIRVESMFGNTVTEMQLENRAILRGSARNFSALWSDPPAFGRFTPTLTLTSQAGEKTVKMATITILPPWWWFVIMAVAFGIPVFMWWRNRQIDWEEYLEEDWEEEFAWEDQ